MSEMIQVPRERRLILDGSPCDVNFYSGGSRTVVAAKEQPSKCPHLDKCRANLNCDTSWMCVMQLAVEVAQNAIKEGKSVHNEVFGDFREFFDKECNPPKGFVHSDDRQVFVNIAKSEALQKIEQFQIDT